MVGILGETMTSSIHSVFTWPLVSIGLKHSFGDSTVTRHACGYGGTSFGKYRIVASSRPGYYSILDPFVQRSQASNFPFINTLKILGCATDQDILLLGTLQYINPIANRDTDYAYSISLSPPHFESNNIGKLSRRLKIFGRI